MEIFNEINLENSYSENNSLKEKSYINSLNSTDISFSINNENSNRYSFKNLNELRLSYMNKLFKKKSKSNNKKKI